MKFIDLLLGATAVAAVVAAPTTGETSVHKKRKSKFQFTGVNESGAEFGNTALPGQLNKDYTWPAHSTIDTLVGKGMNIFRVPTMMERIIPGKLTGSFNETYVAGLDDIIKYITGKGAYAILDPHNFGRAYGNIITDTAGFKTWWTTVAKRYASNGKVIFDTNNEYHDMDNTLVASLNQAAIDGIRAAGATSQYIFVEGNSWSGAWHWVSSGTATGMVSLTDPQDKIVYEMHQYLDSDGSGTSTSCVSTTIGKERVTEATAWLKANGKKGIIGETAGGANSQCISAVDGMLSYMQDNSDVWTGWLWWGGGPWWGDYIYSMEPPSGVAYTGVLPSITKYI
ncbi:glycoside hydrolase superfamily [Truncatella angustata]|uniref:cellulase n=1 Tax=Truncatella angustata TaxID=152316 RepID=A0A9P8UD36_9PEZI|nr:glycoside hydrolase superfamily [Truncatella angustata]KAH6646702.1 glycoside hydrolase superfamily [Truncatella angustata]